MYPDWNRLKSLASRYWTTPIPSVLALLASASCQVTPPKKTA